MSSELINIQNLIKIYDERKRKTMKPNPFSIFFLKNGRRITAVIADKNKRKPEPIEIMNQIKYEWKILPINVKVIYFKAAIELGFNPKKLFSSNPEMRAKLDERLAIIRDKLN